MAATNKRIRSRRSRTGTDLARETRSSGPRVIKARKRDLDHEIQRLECLIAEAPARLRQERLRNRDMVPPMELDTPPLRSAKRRVPLQQSRARNRRTTLLLLELAVIGTGIISIAVWLNQWFKLWI